MEDEPKKTVTLMEREKKRDQMVERVTETTYRRKRTLQRWHESDISDENIPQVELRKVYIENKKKEMEQSTSLPIQSELKKLMSFWDLIGSERADRRTPGSLLELEASTEMTSPKASIPENNSKIIEVELTIDSPSTSPEIAQLGDKENQDKTNFGGQNT